MPGAGVRLRPLPFRLVVKRDGAGKIIRITKKASLREYLKALVLVFGISACSLLFLADSYIFPAAVRDYRHGAVVLGGMVLAGIAALVLGRMLLSLTGYTLKAMYLADGEGVFFRPFFRELGQAPWSSVDNLRIQPAERLSFSDGETLSRGPLYLVAELNKNEIGLGAIQGSRESRIIGWLGLLSFASRRFVLTLPPPSFDHPAPPFGAIECERNIDLNAAKTALEELRAQVSAHR